MEFNQIYAEFLNSLEEISEEHDELTDTDVRERLHEVINWYFIWGHPIDKDFPRLYGMFSLKGDELVANAVRAFVSSASIAGGKYAVGQERNDAIENQEIFTASGKQYDEFLGLVDAVLPARKPASDDLYGDYNQY